MLRKLLFALIISTLAIAPVAAEEIQLPPQQGDRLQFEVFPFAPDDQLAKLGIELPSMHYSFRVELEDSQPRFHETHEYFHRSTNLAAQYYALASGDFSVTFTELIDAGFFPFTAVGPSASYVTDVDKREWIPARMLDNIGTREWLLAARQAILLEFYAECFSSQSGLNQIVPSAFGRVSQFWDSPYTVTKLHPIDQIRIYYPGIEIAYTGKVDNAQFPFLERSEAAIAERRQAASVSASFAPAP